MSGMAKRFLSGDAEAHESISVTDTAVGFTVGTWKSGAGTPHTRAFVTNRGGVVSYRYDGGTPTATSGHLLSHGDSIAVEGSVNVGNFKAIRAGDTNGSLDVTYERVYG